MKSLNLKSHPPGTDPLRRGPCSFTAKACGLLAIPLLSALAVTAVNAAVPDPVIVLDASALTPGPDLASWPSTGTLATTFDKFAGGTGPTVTTILGKKAVEFVQINANPENRRTLASATPTPSTLSGSNPWTISTLIYRSATQPGGENSFFQWAGGAYSDRQSAIFRYTNNGAYIHWGADSGFNTVPSAGAWHHVTITYDGTTEVIYVDGVADKSDLRTLAINAGGLMILGGRTWRDVRGEDQYWRFNGAIASLKVYEAALSAAEVAALVAVPKHTIAVDYGSNGTISPAPASVPGTVTVDEGDSPTFTMTPALGYKIQDVLVDGASNPAAVSAGSHTFTNVTTSTHSISATFEVLPPQLVSGKVTDGTNGVQGAKVYFKLSAPAYSNPQFTATTDAAGNYSISLPPATWYAAAGSDGYDLSADQNFTVSNAPVPLDFVLTANPNWDVIFSLNTDAFSAIADDERITSWACDIPTGTSMPAFNTWNNGLPELGPVVETIGGVKWEKNVRATYSENPPPTVHTRQDGFQFGGDYLAPIPANGASIVTVVRPERKAISDAWTSIVDVFYNRLVLGVRNDNGNLIVWRNGSAFNGPAIPNAQKTILSLVVQPDGQFKVFANGIEVMNVTSTSDMSALVPGGANHEKRIRVGRGWDDWTVFNGNIGDTYLYKTAIDDTKRAALEADLTSKFGIAGPVYYTIDSSSGGNGSIAPTPSVSVLQGASQTFTFAAAAGYVPDMVTIDGGTPVPAVGTNYTFPNVQAAHTISVTFRADPNWDILFSLNTDDLGAIDDGARIFTWNGYTAYQTYNNEQPLLGPTVEVIDGVKWEKNVRAPYNDSVSPTIHDRADGFAIGSFPSGIATAGGVTIMAVVKPEYKVMGGEPRGEIVNIFYGELFLATNRNNGEVIVCTKGYDQHNTGYFIPDGQKTILSLVVQPTGEVTLYANGVRKWTYASGDDYTSLQWFASFDRITVGRNGYDGWSTFNGNIGDVTVYRTALDSTTRETRQSALASKFGITLPVLHTITATAGPGGTISPSGEVEVEHGTNQTFILTPDFGYAVDTLLVDGEDAMVEMFGNTYTFYDVEADQTIEVTFSSSALLYDDWTWYHAFETNEDTLPGANPDNDSLPNFAEFALDGDPLSAADSGKIRSRVEQVGGESALTITLPVLTGAAFGGTTSQSATISGVTYIIEGSNNLVDFDQVVTEVTPASTGNPDLPLLTIDGVGGWSYRTFRLAGAIPARGATGFLRVRVEQAAPN